jgi:aspartokinase-like uncharacterized kinase
MWVVKLGGSLARSSRLQDWLSALAKHGAGRAIIVPGGGPFADLVRAEQARAGFSDSAAHRMAILAMEQFGFMLEALHPGLCTAATVLELRDALANGRVPVWLAYPMVIRDATLPQDWSVTADSLALWLAIQLNAEALLLVKSAALEEGSVDIASLVAGGAVDRHFPVLARQYAGQIHWLGPDVCAQIKNDFATGTPPGMRLSIAAG